VHFLIFARSYFTRESSLRLVIVLIAGIAMAGLWAFVQVAFEQGPSSFVRRGLMRAHGAFGEPNPFGAFAWAITLPVIAYAVLHRESRAGLRWACALAGVGGMVVLALTQSRGGVLGALGGLAVIAFMLIARRRERTLLTGTIAVSLVAAAGIAVVVVAEPWSEMDQATTPANWANQERTAHWAAASEMIKQNPVSGVGAGGFGDHYRDATRFWRFRISQGHAHNAYLQVAAEIGLPGLLAYGLLLASILGSLIRRSLDLDQRWLAVGVAAVTVALVIHQLVDFLHVLSLGVLFAGLWAAALPAGNKGIPSREHNIAP
jgi:O-antigen ligase